LAAGRRLADDLDLGVGGQQLHQPGAQQLVVVGQQHPDHGRCPW
jgi:hypothetical protein